MFVKLFESSLKKPEVPSTDTFNYVFNTGRRSYSRDKVLYRMDGTNETLTLDQLENKARRLAIYLKDDYGINPGDVISIYAKDRIQFPIAWFGALAAGATVALIPVQSGMSAEDVGARISQAESKLVITDSKLLKLAECAISISGYCPLMTMDITREKGTRSIDEIIQDVLPDRTVFQLNSAQDTANQDAFLNRTSGSTGAMKSVITTHAHYIASLEGNLGTVPDDTDPDNDTWLASSSLGFFINAKLFMSLNVLLGIPVVLMREPLNAQNVSIIKRHSINFLLVFPPVVATLVRSNINPHDLSSVKWLLSAGAPIPQNLRDELKNTFPNVDLTMELGTSETLLVAMQTSSSSTRQIGSSGTLVNGMQARVLDTNTGKDLEPNEKGELLVRNVLAPYKGYKNNPEANKDFDADGWFHTGDFGYLDEECNVYVIDRLKELLRVGDGYGSRISVSDLEDTLFEHPAVRNVVVVGVYNEELARSEPTAYIVPTEEYRDQVGKPLADDILRSVSDKLTGLKSVSGGVYFMDNYPTTGFKINRKAIKTLERDEEQKVVPPMMESKGSPKSLSPKSGSRRGSGKDISRNDSGIDLSYNAGAYQHEVKA